MGGRQRGADGAARVTLGMIVGLMWVGYFTGAGTLGALLATVLLVVSVGAEPGGLGVAASYWIVRVVLGAFWVSS